MLGRFRVLADRRRLAGLLISCALVAFVGGYAWRENSRPRILEAFVFDMDVGRSSFIRTPDDKRILVDAGGASETIKRLTDILPFYSRRIDAVFVSDPDNKNASGLVDIVSRYSVGRAYIPAVTLQSAGLATTSGQAYAVFLKELESRGVPIVVTRAGDAIEISDEAAIRALFPAPPDVFTYSKAHIPELAFTVEYGSTSIAYMASASKKAQAFIASSSVFSSGPSTPGSSQRRIVVFSRPIAPGTLSQNFLAVSQPEEIVFIGSKARKASSDRAPSGAVRKPSKEAAAVGDMLQGIRIADIRAKGSVRIVSDGQMISVEPWGSH